MLAGGVVCLRLSHTSVLHTELLLLRRVRHTLTPAACHAALCSAGRLTAAGLCQTVAALQPADTVLVDESLTSGNAYWEASKVCEKPRC